MAGWVDGLLERVMADPTCTTSGVDGGMIEQCQTFSNRLQTNGQMASCSIKPFAKGNLTGPFKNLPGCNPIEYGPQPATQCNESTPNFPPKLPLPGNVASIKG